jgi:large subunit ribosomal protein L29
MKKKEIKVMSYAELVSKQKELTKKYMDLRFQLVIGHVENPLQKRIMRREIATLNTLIRQHDIAGQGNK